MKYPNLALENDIVKYLLENYNNLYIKEKTTTYEKKLKLFARDRKLNQIFESFHDALQELAKTWDLANLNSSL